MNINEQTQQKVNKYIYKCKDCDSDMLYKQCDSILCPIKLHMIGTFLNATDKEFVNPYCSLPNDISDCGCGDLPPITSIEETQLETNIIDLMVYCGKDGCQEKGIPYHLCPVGSCFFIGKVDTRMSSTIKEDTIVVTDLFKMSYFCALKQHCQKPCHNIGNGAKEKDRDKLYIIIKELRSKGYKALSKHILDMYTYKTEAFVRCEILTRDKTINNIMSNSDSKQIPLPVSTNKSYVIKKVKPKNLKRERIENSLEEEEAKKAKTS